MGYDILELNSSLYVSEVEGIFDVVADLLLLAQTFLEMVYPLRQEVVHLQLLFNHSLQFLYIPVHIEVNITHSLYL